MQHQKIFFIGLSFLCVLIASYFSYRATGACFDFFTLKESAQARILRWEVKETKGKFPLKAYYSFEAQGKLWQGETRLSEPWHLNEPSAIEDLQGKAKRSWIVWFNPKYPSQSSLEKKFPIGLLIRASVCYGVIIYFYFAFRRFVKINL